MAYDWSGGRVRRFRQLKFGVAVSAAFLTLLMLGTLYVTV